MPVSPRSRAWRGRLVSTGNGKVVGRILVFQKLPARVFDNSSSVILSSLGEYRNRRGLNHRVGWRLAIQRHAGTGRRFAGS